MVVKRYVRALFETAEEADRLHDVKTDISAMAKIMNEVPEIRSYCLKPHTNRKQEHQFVELSFFPYVGAFTKRMLTTLCANGRLAAVPFVPAAFAELEEQRGDTISAEIESARTLPEDVLDKITAGLMRKSGKKIRLHLRILPELLGGFRIIWQNRILDMSVLGRIQKLRRVLK